MLLGYFAAFRLHRKHHLLEASVLNATEMDRDVRVRIESTVLLVVVIGRTPGAYTL